MRSWSQGDAPATCEISLVLTSVLWLKHRHFTHFSWAILKVLPSGETRKMNLCGTQNSQFLDVFGSVVFGSQKTVLTEKMMIQDWLRFFQHVPMTFQLTNGVDPMEFPIPVTQRISSNSQGVGFPNFYFTFFPSKSSLFSTKIKMCSTKHHMFFSQRIIIFHHFPTNIISHPEKHTIYIYISNFPAEMVCFFPLAQSYFWPGRSEARWSDTRRPADGSQGHDPGAPLAVPQEWWGLAGKRRWKNQ